MKKKIGITCALWLWVITLIAQTNSLSTLQYWWDDDLPNSVQKTISGSPATVSETADAAILLDGLHRLNYRIKDSHGAWSQTVTSYFLKRTNQQAGGNALSTLQYWWDDNVTNSIQKTVSGNGMVQLNETGDVSALLDGLHRLNYRIKDARGSWSQTVSQYFLKHTNVPNDLNVLNVLQYWWDDNVANSIQKNVSGNGMVQLNETGDVSALLDGLHRLSYRVKDTRGSWSQTVSQYFLKHTNVPNDLNVLNVLQYWWDDNATNSIQKTVSGNGIVQLDEVGDVSALLDGLHRLNYRVKDNRGAWSQTITSYFLKRTNIPVGDNALSTLEYWLDNNYATVVQKTITSDISVIIDEAGEVSALSDGVHRLSFRLKDSRNQYSAVETYAFIKYGADFPEPEISMNDGKIFQIFDVRLTWNEASDLCRRLGGRLAIAETASDSAFLVSQLPANSTYYWLGNEHNYYMRKTSVQSNFSGGKLSESQDYPSNNVAVGFIFEKELDGVGSLEVTLPSENIYKNMTLELRKDSSQHFSLTTTDKQKYRFNGVPNGIYKLTLKNKSGAVLGQINDVTIRNKKLTNVAFDNLATIYSVRLNIITSQNLSGKPSVKWYDENDMFLNQGDTISGLTAGMKLKYQIALNETHGKIYVAPPMQDYTVVEGNNAIQYALQEIPSITLEGKVKAEDGGWISGAVITVSQLLNGKYSKIITGKTDKDGKFSLQAYNDSSTLIVSYPNYLNQTLVRSNFNDAVDLGIIALSPVKGATVTLNLTYTPSVAAGETPTTENWYSAYQNVDYTLYNVTQGKAINNLVVQYPDIVLLDSVGINDEIRITANSRAQAFKPVQTIVTMDTLLRATAMLNIIQFGSVQATYTESQNSRNVGILYDAAGHRVNQYTYSGNTLQTGDLPDGNYQLVSMASSSFFNTLSNLSAFTSAGLKQNTDYVLQSVMVESGKIMQVSVPNIPLLDESKWYYTGNKTQFSVNKQTITAGNYLTLRSEMDFKDEYKSKVSNVKLVVELPEQCSFVYNSVMVGNTISAAYTFADNRLTLPLANYSDIVKFCVIPTQGGNYAPNGFVQFDMDGKTILQPIGTASFKVENMSLTVPSLTAQKTIPVRGVTTANSEIKVFDGDMLIGQTTALANGNWSLQCELYKPYALSYHNIHAEAQTPQGLTIMSDVREITHNITAIEVSKVTMINVAHPATSLDLCEYVTVFDFQNPTNVSQNYWYWPNYPDFTFKIEFTSNDTTKISNVDLYVKTSSNNVVKLPTTYDGDKGYWTATGKFHSGNLPVNVSVDYLADTESLLDRGYLDENYEFADILINEYREEIQFVDSILSKIDIELSNDNVNYFKVNDLYGNLNEYFGIGVFINDNLPNLDNMNNSELQNYIEQFIKRSEDLINTTDTLVFNNLIESSIYGTYSFVEAEIEKNIMVSTCDGINESELESLGFVKYNTTDSHSIYVKIEDKYYQYIDYAKNITFIIPIEDYSKNTLRSTNSLNQIISYITKLAEIITDLQAKYQLVTILGQDIAVQIDKALSDVEKQYRACQTLRESFTDLNSTVMIDDKSLSNVLAEEEKLAKQYRELLSTRKSWDKCLQKVTSVMSFINNCIAYKKELEAYLSLYNSVPECPCHPSRTQDLKNEIIYYGSLSGAYYVASFSSDAIAISGAFASTLAAPATGGTSLLGTVACITKIVAQIGLNALYSWSEQKTKDRLWTEVNALKWAMRSYCNDCDDDDDNGGGGDGNGNGGNGNGGDGGNGSGSGNGNGGDGGNGSGGSNGNSGDNGNGNGNGGNGNGGGKSGDSGNANSDGQLDPSGYVYEAVPSNRLQGVTASVYYETEEENIYGECIKKTVLWDAENYEQINPQTTDEFGQYSWFVPQGLWQVKYEKDGYETVYSEWLPVPPPQLDVNIAMVQVTQPEVQSVQGYESGINIEFSKFMQPASLQPDSVNVTRNGTTVSGIVELLNVENNFVSKIRFVPETSFAVSDEVILTVKREVESYAGITMSEDFVQQIPVQKELQSLIVPQSLNLVLNDKEWIDVSVTPKEVAKDKKILARTVASSIASVTKETVLNADGEAILEVNAELPGSTVLYVSVEGTDLKAEVTVNVFMPNTLRLDKPTASLPTSSIVAKNTEIELLSDKMGARIYYTLDNSNPSATTGIEYTQPIVLLKNTIIKAVAVRDGMLNSEVAIFEYTVNNTGIDPVEKQTVTVFTRNQAIYIKGLKAGEPYKVYSVLGNIIAQGYATDESEQQIILPNKGVYIVSILKCRKKVLLK